MIIGKREVVVTVDYQQVDDLIREQFGIDSFEIIAAEEWGNDEDHRFDLTRVEDEPSTYDMVDIEKAKAGEWAWKTRILLEDLVRREILEPAVYVICVSW